MEKLAQGFGEALFVFLEGFVGGGFEVKSVGGFDVIVQTGELGLEVGGSAWRESEGTVAFGEPLEELPMTVGGVVLLIDHAELGEAVLAVEVAGPYGNRMAIDELDRDLFPGCTGRGWKMRGAVGIRSRDGSVERGENFGGIPACGEFPLRVEGKLGFQGQGDRVFCR